MQIEHLIRMLKKKEFKGITCNSRDVGKGYIFIALKGSSYDGNKFIDEAVSRGAKAVVFASDKLKGRSRGVYWVKVADARLSAARLASEFYGNPSGKIKVVGVTGTNGKTTVTYLLESILREAGVKCGVIGTINYRFNNNVFPAGNTTPGALDLQSFMQRLIKGGNSFLAMEVSSHALEQERVGSINFHSAIFTNLTQDHLDYHKTMRNYFLAKLKLFKNLPRGAIAVLNRDDKYYPLIKKSTKARIISYGFNPASMVRAVNIEYGLQGTHFDILFCGRAIKVSTSLIGRHNIYNILAASAWAYGARIGIKHIARAVNNFQAVPGRLERIPLRKRVFFVFVDYAHTEDALNNVLNSLRALNPRRIITVFGCGGERDKKKRPRMGRVATELSDFSIITNDNPRGESPERIVRDIRSGIRNKRFTVMLDRAKAIKKAILMAGKGDIVLVAGKGHEDYQLFKNRKKYFSDREAVRSCLKSLN